MMHLEDSTFTLYAAKYYDNPHCHDIDEFNEDVMRFSYVLKLLNRYRNTGELRERLILNHLIVIYNTFGDRATEMLFLKMEGNHDLLKPFVEFLAFLPPVVQYANKTITTTEINADAVITEKLKEI
jgi:hypothetical protein